MFATVTIYSQKSNQILAVPTQAVSIENNRFWVMKETSPEKFTKVEVKIGKVVKGYTQILSGLNENDRIITQGALFAQAAYNLM
jgi:multidrug efflux pump subunit AcrA (membrane-fusion protein)